MDAALEAKLRVLNEAFLEENAKLNLTALRESEQCFVGNVLDSLPLLEILPRLFIMRQGRRVLDLGTGGGFPLLPLAIALPDVTFYGLDATKKKLDAVSRIVSRLEITNVRLLYGRAEELARHPDLREQFDLVTSRAVAPISVLLEYAMPFLKVASRAVFWKSLHIAEEQRASVSALSALHAQMIFQHTYALPADFGSRQLLVYEKSSATAQTYPRAVGVPKKSPL